MTNARRRAVPLFIALLAAGCGGGTQNAATTSDADVKAINAAQDRELALVTVSMDSIGAVYTDDIDFMPPGEPAIKGLDAVKTWAQAMLADATMSGTYTSSNVIVSGDVAIARYTATLSTTPKAGGPAMEEALKGVHVFKRQPGGGWKIAMDVWNPDKPETAPPAAATSAPAKKK